MQILKNIYEKYINSKKIAPYVFVAPFVIVFLVFYLYPIISTIIMMVTFGPADPSIGYAGKAYEGVPVLPKLAGYISGVFKYLFGFESPELIAFPITSLGAVGAALSLVKAFIAEGIVGGNEIAVFTAMGMCWSGYLSTHTAMLDTLGCRKLTSKALISHTVGGLVAGIFAHYLYVVIQLI